MLPWKEVQHPIIETTLNDEQYLVLHALLLHNSLPADVLSWLLPLSDTAVFEALMRLEQAELIESTQGIWQVSAIGYPEARRLLNDADYLIDDF